MKAAMAPWGLQYSARGSGADASAAGGGTSA
jgi:hypothetical protein